MLRLTSSAGWRSFKNLEPGSFSRIEAQISKKIRVYRTIIGQLLADRSNQSDRFAHVT
jgi:hypothetical protein